MASKDVLFEYEVLEKNENTKKLKSRCTIFLKKNDEKARVGQA